MGMTDAQFKVFIRFVLNALKSAIAEPDETKKEQMFKTIVDDLQKCLED